MERHPTRSTHVLSGTACAAVLLALTLTGCTSGGTAEAAAPEDQGTASVIAPGRPGEEARTLTPAEVLAESEARDLPPNEADVTYVSMMITHHEQALEMTALADRHADDTGVRRLAERITAAQTPEIEMLRAWMENYEEDSADAHHGHGHSHGDHDADGGHGDDHADMPGMATPEELAALEKARGTEFDQLFLQLMITHHDGAVTMSVDALAEGDDLTISELATEIAAQQSAEVGRMDQMLEEL
ncbi:DUF305 domain-containing protein [Streptomyces otsuchiensis]|uniref:DUF305 domain-containing protein n=1 Tax=Streptomyces otsuchiensis TaxID=2681388 RepID=UPI0010304647|nr:DUF305 domain-containing protein [Streptomyces otsuchiensis]